MSGACFPVGRCTLLVHHHGISQPSPASWRLASSSQALSGPCYSHHRVVHDAEAQRLMEYLYTPRYCYISPLCFTAQRRLQGHDLATSCRNDTLSEPNSCALAVMALDIVYT